MSKRKTILGIPKCGQPTTCAPYAPPGCSNPSSSDVTRNEIEVVCGRLGSHRGMAGAMLAMAIAGGIGLTADKPWGTDESWMAAPDGYRPPYNGPRCVSKAKKKARKAQRLARRNNRRAK